MNASGDYSFELPEAVDGVIRRLRLHGLSTSDRPRGKYGPQPPFSWSPGAITDRNFPPTASRWGRRVTPHLAVTDAEVLPEWGARALRESGARPAEAGELIVFALVHTPLVMTGRFVAAGQYWRDPSSNADLMVCSGPHNGQPCLFQGIKNVPVPPGTIFLGIRD